MLRTAPKRLLPSSSFLLSKTPIAHQRRNYDSRPTKPAVEKKHGLDVQSEESQRGMKEREDSINSPETRGKKKEPEKEFKKAPGPVIGMQDERGGSMSIPISPPWSSIGVMVGL
jgi:hypothetical protein